MTRIDSALLKPLVPRVLGAVLRRHRDLALAEDSVQEALLAASQQWPSSGLPTDPCAWLVQVACRRAIDRIRADAARARRHDAVGLAVQLEPGPARPDAEPEDDTLALLLMCCHPVLDRPSAIALTLRAIGGLTTAEIAAAYFVPEATMAQRISRAKRRIRRVGMRFEMPAPAELGSRLEAVLHVLYLMFNEGYTASGGSAVERVDLAAEAIRIARLLHAAVPDHPEATGLLGLLLLTHARREARTDETGALVALDEQDRTRWDHALIEEGTALTDASFAVGRVGPYQLQAAIAALHGQAPSTAETDWRQICGLYEVLERMVENPMVSLSRIVALSMVDGPDVALAMLDRVVLRPDVGGHHRVDAVRGHLYERAGKRPEAIAHYRAAAGRAANAREREYLLNRASRIG